MKVILSDVFNDKMKDPEFRALLDEYVEIRKAFYAAVKFVGNVNASRLDESAQNNSAIVKAVSNAEEKKVYAHERLLNSAEVNRGNFLFTAAIEEYCFNKGRHYE
jgi:hypothetical protein